MSRISAPPDRPIPTNEPVLATQQTSETESVQKTDVQGKALPDAEQSVKQHTPSTDTKGAQFESQLGGLARQSELQLQFPAPSGPTLKDLPDMHPNLDPNIHLDEKIDVTKNLPDGHAINKGLEGLDWGPSKAQTGPGHFGVEMTYGGMKAPTDRIAEVLNSKKPGQPNASAPHKDDRNTMTTADGNLKGNSGLASEGKGGSLATPPPGVELSSRAPKWGQLSWTVKGVASAAVDYVKDVILEKVMPPGGGEAINLINGPSLVKEVTGDEKDLLRGVQGATTGGSQVEAAKKLLEDDKTMTDPDAAGGTGGAPTSDEIERAKVRLGQAEHGVNPDLGVGGGPIPMELKKPIDLLRDPIGDEESAFETSTPERAKLAADIHGPRTVNPDSGFGPVRPGGNRGGGDPS